MTDMRVGIRVGSTLDRSFNRSMETVEQRQKRLRGQFEATDRKLKAAGGVIKYRRDLANLREKQATLGHSSERAGRVAALAGAAYGVAR